MIKDIRFLRFFLLTVNIICYIPSSICNLNASDKEIINLGRFYIANGEYYNAITEMMRYQSLFPEGEYFPDSLLLMAKAYYEGDNYHNAVDALSECYSKFKNRHEGERNRKPAMLVTRSPLSVPAARLSPVRHQNPRTASPQSRQ